MINNHEMRLHDEPFKLIQNGSKTIELRLNDEKRQLIKIGDEIVFTNRVTGENIKARVINIYKSSSFSELYNIIDTNKLGYDYHLIDMDIYYSKEEQDKYGVLGIEIELI